MIQPFMGIGMAVVIGFVAPALQAERPNNPVQAIAAAGDASTVSDSWVMLAGCPEACPPSVRPAPPRLASAEAALDGNAWIMALNLAEDGLEATRDEAPSFDPGAGQDLVWALNRSNDGLGDRAIAPRRAPQATLTPVPRQTRCIAVDGFVVPDFSAALRLASWAWENYEGALAEVQRRWSRTTRAFGIALIQSWLANSTSTSSDDQMVDPELQPPLDPLTTAWIESARLAEPAKPDVWEVGGTGLAADDRAATMAVIHDEAQFETGTSEILRLASEESQDSLKHSPSASDAGTPTGGEIGCEAIGLPSPIDAPERTRTIGF